MLSCLIFLFYLWTATSSNRPFHPRDTSRELYNQLTDSLLRGHTYLAARPSPELLALSDPYDPLVNERFRLLDASLYRGRYYVYFGVAPAVTLYVPWRLLTGARLSDDIAVSLYCMGGYVFSCLLLFLLLDASKSRVPWFLQLAAVCCLGLGQVAPIVLRRPRVYEVAVSAAFCFLLGGLYFLARRMLRPEASRWLPAAAAVFLGLATASRPHCAIAALIFSSLYGVWLGRARGWRRWAWLGEFARFGVPLAVAAALIGWYNYSRFDNPFEFGIRYQVTVLDYSKGGVFLFGRLRNIAASLYYLLVCPPNFLSRFPFLELSGAAQPFGRPGLLPKDYFQEPLAGVWLISPLCIAGFALPFFFWKLKRFGAEARALLGALSVCGWAMFAAVCSVPLASARYELDFVPLLSIAGLVLCLWLSAHLSRRWMRAAAASLILAGCMWASAVGVALSVNSYGYPLERPRSAPFRRLATVFGAGPEAMMNDVQSLRLDATVVFPSVPAGTREALIASGIYERWDLVLVEYQSGGTASFGFVHCGVSDTLSPGVLILPGKPYRLTVDYSAIAGKLAVRLDDRTVLDVATELHPSSRDRVTVGRIRVGRFKVRNFSGRIGVARGGLQFLAQTFVARKILTSSPALETVSPAAELLNLDLDGILAHSQHAVYGKEPSTPRALPRGVFRATDDGDHLATAFQPIQAPGASPAAAVEIAVAAPPYFERFERVNMVLQDQDYNTLYSSGSLPTGEDRAMVALPAGTRAVRLAFLTNEGGYIVLPRSVRLRGFSRK